MSSPSRCTAAVWRSCSAASTGKASPISGWSAATASTCSSTCSAADSLTGVRVFFPDPWPKARHHKRRLLQPATIALIADRLRPGGVLHAATDHAGYADQIAEVGDAEPRLRRSPPARAACPSRWSGPTRSMKRRPSTPVAPSPNCSGRNGHERHRRNPGCRSLTATDGDARRHPPGAAGVGRTQPRHGPGLDPRRQADRRAPATLRRARSLAAVPHRGVGRGPARHLTGAGGHRLHQHRPR